MRVGRLGLVVAMLWASGAGCAANVVYRNPATGATVDCTLEAQRLVVASVYGTDGDMTARWGTALGVPRPVDVPAGVQRYDYERQCAAGLRAEGWQCLTGCE